MMVVEVGMGMQDLLGSWGCLGLGFFTLLAIGFGLVSSAQPRERYPVPWDHVEKETLDHFLTLVRTDTTSPPGNETRVAEYLKRILEGEGIPARLLALDPKRANLLARIRGNGSKRPILVMGHTHRAVLEEVSTGRFYLNPGPWTEEHQYARQLGNQLYPIAIHSASWHIYL